jgi:hypothetical protein
MVALLLATTISCSEAISLIGRLTKTVGLTHQQKMEIIQTIKGTIPICPVKVETNERPKSHS